MWIITVLLFYSSLLPAMHIPSDKKDTPPLDKYLRLQKLAERVDEFLPLNCALEEKDILCAENDLLQLVDVKKMIEKSILDKILFRLSRSPESDSGQRLAVLLINNGADPEALFTTICAVLNPEEFGTLDYNNAATQEEIQKKWLAGTLETFELGTNAKAEARGKLKEYFRKYKGPE